MSNDKACWISAKDQAYMTDTTNILINLKCHSVHFIPLFHQKKNPAAVSTPVIHPKLFKLSRLRQKIHFPAKTWRNLQLKKHSKQTKKLELFSFKWVFNYGENYNPQRGDMSLLGTSSRHFRDNLLGVSFQTLHCWFPLRKIKTCSLGDEAVSRRVVTCHFSLAEGSKKKKLIKNKQTRSCSSFPL